jgi:hypothetical protein
MLRAGWRLPASLRSARAGAQLAAGELAPLVPQRHQAAQVEGDVVGLALVCVLYLCC